MTRCASGHLLVDGTAPPVVGAGSKGHTTEGKGSEELQDGEHYSLGGENMEWAGIAGGEWDITSVRGNDGGGFSSC